MSARKQLAEALAAALDGWQIISDPRAIDTVRKPGAVVLWTAKLTRSVRHNGLVTADLVLWVLTATSDPEKLEDDLDGLLETVAGVLEPLDAFIWTEAERGVLADTYEGYRLTLTCNYKIDTE